MIAVNNKIMNKNDILQNLKDAGCNSEIADRVIMLSETGNSVTALNILAKHKMKLLDNLHKTQKKIDCLDFLIFNFKEQKND